MAINSRKIRENLGRVRTTISRRDFPAAVSLLCSALKELGGQTAPIDIRGDFRTAIADICGHPDYKQSGLANVSYQPGKEREILAHFNKFYNELSGQEEEEDYETTLQRKLALDRAICDGKVFVSQGKFSDADDCFSEAMKYYKDEIAAFAMMAKAMMDAGQYVRALGYVRKGLEKKPDNADLAKLGEECNRMRAKSGK